jgi:hypothetical protein
MLFNPIISKEKQAEISKLYEQSLENIGEAVVYMGKEAALKTSAMSGELFASNDDSILLNVPNALVRGAFAALDENGISLPEKDGKFNAHIVVFTPDEVQRIGGIEKVTERGKHFHYSISGIQEAQAANIFDFSRVWFMPVSSPELSQLRRTYGLDSSPGKHGFNIVVAMRKIGVLGHNQIKKVAAKDILPGGEADNVPDSDFDKKKLEHGKKHEMEHTENPDIAKEVAKDHMLEDEDYYKKVEEIEKKSLASDALQHMLVHYSRNKHDVLKPLSYEELVVDRTSGRWEDQPDKAKQYVNERKKLEDQLRKRLRLKGLQADPNKSFLYATISGKEQFGTPGSIKHEAPLAQDIIDSSFFDVVGLPKSRTGFGQKGLMSALKRWEQASSNGGLKETEYMGMKIRPRIEVITTKEIKPIKAESNESEAD